MIAKVVPIGNSKGIRIPALILKECEISDVVDLEVRNGKVILSPVDLPRKDWDKKYSAMHENGDDNLLLNDVVDLDSEDWEW